MLNLSVVIATKNSADRIEGTIKPWLFADEILVVDQMSADGTGEIAKKTGATVITHEPPHGNFDLNRKLGIEKTKTQWILYMDTDERPTDELLKEVKSFLQSDDAKPGSDINGAKIPNLFYFLGKSLRHGIYNPKSAEIRLFRKGTWNYPCEEGYHRGISVSGKTITFKNPYKHFNVNSLSEWFIKTNQYTELDASAGKAKTWPAFFSFIRFFIKYYLFKKGFLDGFHGFLAVFYFGLYHFTLSVKSWEKSFLRDKKLEQDFLNPFDPKGR